MKRDLDMSWLRDWRFAGLVGILAGFLIGLLVFGEPWHLQPNWGDLPTWLLFALALPGLYQLRVFVQNNAEETKRNIKRDKLMDRQLAEAGRRADSDQRMQAEGINVTWYAAPRAHQVIAVVENKSRRPITRIFCRLASDDGQLLERPDQCGEMLDRNDDGTLVIHILQPKPVDQFNVLRPRSAYGFAFKEAPEEPHQLFAFWFSDDAGIRWQLDDHMHLVEVDDGELQYKTRADEQAA